MRNSVTSQTGVGNSAPIALDKNVVDFLIGLACVKSGTVNYTIQHTYDNIYDTTITPTWFDHGVANLVAATTNQEGNFVIPVSAVRIVMNSGTGTVTLTVTEQGIR